jgi:electron transfer flavoprotein beta subunit
MNPFDEYAVEEAIRIKERLGKGEVTVITLGPESAKEVLLTALAMGADKALHIKGENHLGVDSYTTAFLLSEAIKGRFLAGSSPATFIGSGPATFDVILCGKEATDDQNGAVGIQLAELLDIPHVAVITKLEVDATGRAIAYRQIEGGTEIVECTLPALFTCQKGINDPRYPALPGIMRAKRKPYETVSATDLASVEIWKSVSGRLLVKDLAPLPTRKAGRKLQGQTSEMVEELVKFLREEVKLI